MDFDTGFDGFADMDFMGDEDFGLAKNFSTAPMGMMCPGKNLKHEEEAGMPGEA